MTAKCAAVLSSVIFPWRKFLLKSADSSLYMCHKQLGTCSGQTSRLIRSTKRTYLEVCSPYRRSLFLASSITAGKVRFSEEVREALIAEKPVVALESTIITHGMPYPDNAQTAFTVEQIVHENGATPATIAVLAGQICVGLSKAEIEQLASSKSNTVKISRRDFPWVLSQGLSGGTTVSGTVIVAHMAGIPIFATGGIGGVHRGVEETMDISADLRELGRTPVAVVAAGVKSILDISRTLEFLETEGVCVVTYGQSCDFPAFFSPRSGCQGPYHVEGPEEAANMIAALHAMQLASGMLIAVPIPKEHAVSGEAIETAIQEAVKRAKETGISGKDVTPFILQQVNELTQGASLLANIALVKNNARVASEIAVALAEKREITSDVPTATWPQKPTIRVEPSSCDGEVSQSNIAKPVVIGGAVVDFCAKVKENEIKMAGGTYPGKMYQSFGGVGYNVANCLSRLGSKPLFISSIGSDVHGSALLSHSSHMDMSGVRQLEGQSTATYCPVLTWSGQLLFGIGDMDIHAQFSPDMLREFQAVINSSPLVFLDGNFSTTLIEQVCLLCQEANVPVWFDPTDVHKATKPFQTNAWKTLTYTSPNLYEACHMWSAMTGSTYEMPSDINRETTVKVAARFCQDLLQYIPVTMVTLGAYGLLVGQKQTAFQSPSLKLYPSSPPDTMPEEVLSVSGAGDCLNGAMIHFLIQGYDLDFCVKAGLMAAHCSLQSYDAVPASITAASFTPEKVQQWACFQAVDILPFV